MKHLGQRLPKAQGGLPNTQPVRKQMQTGILDKKVPGEEVDRLTKASHDAALKGKKTPPPVEAPPVRDHNPLAH